MVMFPDKILNKFRNIVICSHCSLTIFFVYFCCFHLKQRADQMARNWLDFPNDFMRDRVASDKPLRFVLLYIYLVTIYLLNLTFRNCPNFDTWRYSNTKTFNFDSSQFSFRFVQRMFLCKQIFIHVQNYQSSLNDGTIIGCSHCKTNR